MNEQRNQPSVRDPHSEGVKAAINHAIEHIADTLAQHPATSRATLAGRLEQTHEHLVEKRLATREEARAAIDALKLDLAALGQHLESRQGEWIDWLKLDIRLFAVGLLQTIERAADPTRLGWQKLALELAAQKHDSAEKLPRH